jgi:hypothetical protein
MLNTVSEKCDWYTYVASTLLWIVVVFLRKILMGEDIDSRRADISHARYFYNHSTQELFLDTT